MEIVEQLYQAIVEANIVKAERLAADAIKTAGHQNVLMEILTPLLNHIGDVEQTAVFNLAQGYVASKLVRRILADYEESVRESGIEISVRETVVLCNAEDDCHPVGREIVSSILRGHGWGVSDLGIDIEAVTLVDEAQKVGAKVVGVSAMTYTTASNIEKVREEIVGRGLEGKIKLAVGGIAFRLDHELVAKVGADGTSVSAMQAPALFRRLWDSVVETEEVSHER